MAVPDPGRAAALERVGRILSARREQIDRRYGKREAFIRDRGLKMAARVFFAVEKGERDSYDAGTIAGLTVAYDLPPGWLQDALADPPLIAPLPAPGIPSRDRVIAMFTWLADNPDPAYLDEIESALIAADLTPATRKRMWELWTAVTRGGASRQLPRRRRRNAG